MYRCGKENGVADELSRCHEGSDVAMETSPVFCVGGGGPHDEIQRVKETVLCVCV